MNRRLLAALLAGVLLVSPAFADMYQDASNASLPVARTNLGLGTMATQNANAVAITGGSITGIASLSVTSLVTGNCVTGNIVDAGFGCGPATTNPFGVNYPHSGIFYAGAKPLTNNALRSFGGVVEASNPVPHGMLNSAGAAVFGTNGWFGNTTLDPTACYLGISNPSDLAVVWEEVGAVTECSVAGTAPPIASPAGTFTATTFTPTTPFPVGNLPPSDVIILTNDTPVPFIGWMSSYASSGGNVTSITVTGWYKLGTLSGGTGVAGTPSGSIAYLNWQQNQWNRNTVLRMFWGSVTGTTTNGGATVSGITGADTALLAPFERVSCANCAANTAITSVNANHTSITIDPPATAGGSGVPLTISMPFNRAVIEEGDLNNSTGIAFDPTLVQFTGNATSGSQHVASVSSTTGLYPTMYCQATGYSGDLVSIDRAGSNIWFGEPLPASGATSFVCGQRFDTAGSGININGAGNPGPAFVARGNSIWGFLAGAAKNTGFMAAPGRHDFSPVTMPYGFRADTSIVDFSAAALAITNDRLGLTYYKASRTGALWNLNTNQGPPAPSAGTILQLSGADGQNTVVALDAYGDGVGTIAFRGSHGNLAAPSGVTAGLGSLYFGGYDGAAWSSGAASYGAQIQAIPDSTWTSANHASDIVFATAPTGSIVRANRMWIDQGGAVTVGNAARTGAGAFYAGSYFVGTTAGANCTLTAIAHLTVVNGLVTLCN